MTKKSASKINALTIVTLGVYYFIWQYGAQKEMNETDGDNSISAGMLVFLTIITFGIYGIIWEYKYCKRMVAQGGKDVTSVVLALSITGSVFAFIFPVISVVLSCIVVWQIQDVLNEIVDKNGGQSNQHDRSNSSYQGFR